MSLSFISILGASDKAQLTRSAARARGLTRSIRLPHKAGFELHVAPNTPIVRLGERGLVLGDLFTRAGFAAVEMIVPRAHQAADNEEHIRQFVETCWGSYILFLTDGDKFEVFRDPSGAAPCCHTAVHHEGRAFYSDPSLAREAGMISGEVDWPALATSLRFAGHRTARTALVGVNELLPGCSVSGDGVTAMRWSPWRFASRENQIEDRKAAVAAVREAVLGCSGAWARQAGRFVVELSGGLDSSIVAVASAQVAEDAACFANLVTPDPGADERMYANAVTTRLQAKMETLALDPRHIDIRHAHAGPTARPPSGYLHQAVDQAVIPVALSHQASAFFTGGGGDYVFCYLATAAPAADALRTKGPGPQFLRAVHNLAVMHKTTFATAFRLAIKKSFRKVARPWKEEGRFLSSGFSAKTLDAHPWEAPPGTLPGKAEQVTALIHGQGSQDNLGRRHLLPVRMPLLSQPVVEACLRVPSWMWIEGGRNRSVARDAFRDLLPPEIVNRRTKGDFTAFNAAMFRENRSAIEGFLLEGRLAEAGVIDRAQIEAYLQGAPSPKDTGFARLMKVAAAEAWARSWLDAAPSASSAFQGVAKVAEDREPVLNSRQRAN